MILTRLYEYYQRKQTGGQTLAPFGMEEKEIKYVIEITAEGHFINLSDVRGEKKRGRHSLVPQAFHRSGRDSWQTAYVLWDHTGYVCERSKSESSKDIESAKNQHASFVEQVKTVSYALPDNAGVQAVRRFYETNQLESLKEHDAWEECRTIDGCNITFRIAGEGDLICEHKDVQNYMRQLTLEVGAEEGVEGFCLVTGKEGPIARIHASTAIPGGQATGVLVGFQKSSGYDSYGKEQAFNAPVSYEAMLAYTTAFNYLKRSSNNSFHLGDMTVLFWASSPRGEQLETAFGGLIISPQDNPDMNVNEVSSLLKSISSGAPINPETDRFCILGLTPNSGRIAITLWEENNIGEIAKRIGQYLEDIFIIHPANAPEHLTLRQVLTATAFEDKMDNVVPGLQASVLNSIVKGTPFPMALFQQTMTRVRAEQGPRRKHAAVLKACMNRWAHHSTLGIIEEVKPMIDLEKQNTAYRLGRAFALLEKAQEEALPGLNATIADRCYGTASSSPAVVFPQLIKLHVHHLKKIIEIREIYFKRLMQEILATVTDFPAHLKLQEQGQFALGYYHQRQDFFSKKTADKEGEDE
jgi:CRISPR-associated protein Csd1